MPGTPMKPPTAMVAASIPVAKPTGMVNHMEMRTLAVLKCIMGGRLMDCSHEARGEALSSPPDLPVFMAS